MSKPRADHGRVGALATHAMPEARIVEAPAAHLAQMVQHAVGALGIVRAQPGLEQGRDFERQPQHQERGSARPGAGGGLEQSFDLVVRQGWNHGGHHHADGHAGGREFPHHAQTCLWRRGARLQRPFQAGVETGDADEDRHELARGQVAQQVEIAEDQRALGDDRQRVPPLQQQLEYCARGSQLALGRLVRIGVAADVQHFADVTWRGDFLLQQRR